MHFKKNICEFGKQLYSEKCRHYANLNDYDLSPEERKQIQERNKIYAGMNGEESSYNKGFGNISIEKADLSKYKDRK